jgi:competence protein ComEC
MEWLRSTAEPRTFFWLWSGALTLGFVAGLVPFGWLGVLLIAAAGGWLSGREPRLPEVRFWCLAGLVGLVAYGYCLWRTPQPTALDLSVQAPLADGVLRVKVLEEPKATGKDKATVIAQSLRLVQDDAPTIEGNVYIRFPAQFLKQVYPGVQLEVTGFLTKPRPSNNPGQFDFAAYLARRGVFAVFYADGVKVLTQPDNFVTQVRRKIVDAHVNALGSPRGELLASLLVGSSAAVLDPELQQTFYRVGLAHVLAASGAQVSIILGVCLALLRPLPKFWQALIAGGVLLIYLLLAGLSPSIIRAGVMGYFTLAALVLAKKGDALVLWALAAVLLLIWNPLWIIDLGFQFSFLATLGLLITVPKIEEKLPMFPPVIATNIAVALAAYVWTLPLQLETFGKLSPYALPSSLFAVVIVEILTIAGFVVSPLVFVSAELLKIADIPLGFLVDLLIIMVKFFANLPGSTLNPGALSSVQMYLLYALLVFFHIPTSQPRLIGAMAGGILFLPSILPLGSQVEFIIFDSGKKSPLAVLRNEGQVFILNNANPKAIQFVLRPYFQQEGITNIAGFIGLGKVNKEGYLALTKDIPVNRTWAQDATLNKAIPLNPTTILRLGKQTFVRVLSLEPLALVVQTEQGRVLYLGRAYPSEQGLLRQRFQGELANVDWLWTDQAFLLDSFFTLPKLKGCIFSGAKFSEMTRTALAQYPKLTYVWTSESGAVTWTGGEQLTRARS